VTVIPLEFDWVKARAACSVEKVFTALQHDVEDDVKVVNALGGAQFEVALGCGADFTVMRIGVPKQSVAFLLQKDCISVNLRNTGEEMQFNVGLNNEGRCQLRWNKQGFERWQVRRVALEEMFFQERV
jgi:hypothetical protein